MGDERLYLVDRFRQYRDTGDARCNPLQDGPYDRPSWRRPGKLGTCNRCRFTYLSSISHGALVNLEQSDELIEHRRRVMLHMRLLHFDRNGRAVTDDNTSPLNVTNTYA